MAASTAVNVLLKIVVGGLVFFFLGSICVGAGLFGGCILGMFFQGSAGGDAAFGASMTVGAILGFISAVFVTALIVKAIRV